MVSILWVSSGCITTSLSSVGVVVAHQLASHRMQTNVLTLRNKTFLKVLHKRTTHISPYWVSFLILGVNMIITLLPCLGHYFRKDENCALSPDSPLIPLYIKIPGPNRDFEHGTIPGWTWVHTSFTLKKYPGLLLGRPSV